MSPVQGWYSTIQGYASFLQQRLWVEKSRGIGDLWVGYYTVIIYFDNYTQNTSSSLLGKIWNNMGEMEPDSDSHWENIMISWYTIGFWGYFCYFWTVYRNRKVGKIWKNGTVTPPVPCSFQWRNEGDALSPGAHQWSYSYLTWILRVFIIRDLLSHSSFHWFGFPFPRISTINL